MEEDIKKMLEENLNATREMQAMVAKTARYLKWLRVMDVLKLLLILIPIIAAWLYLPQFLNDLTAGYDSLLPNLIK
jgi:hypothetical protein